MWFLGLNAGDLRLWGCIAGSRVTAQSGGVLYVSACVSDNARDAAALRRVRASARTIAEEIDGSEVMCVEGL